ncbi:CIR protein [Plasmodium chabaudi adami]|uniref:CIR protein n=1 Tax=Plasmodium chabaudi adami TaxID=5826 RepID=A0A1D3LAW7_PLACE|nr:CIR protein [Plasmodium chabaudi adami]
MMEFGGQTYGLKGKDGELSGQTDGLKSKESRLSGQTRGLKGQRGELSGQNSGFEIKGEIGPKVKGLHRDVKKMNGQTKRLKGQKGGSQVVFGGRSILKDRLKGKEGDFDGQSDVLRGGKKGLKDQKDGYIGISGFQSFIRDKLSGLEGDFYGQSDEFSGSTEGLYGQKGKSLGRWVIQPYLKDSLPGLEGGLEGVLESDSNEQYSTISSKNSGSEIIGGISPKINMSYDTVKGISGETPILKGQEGDVDGHHDVLSVRGSEFIGGITPQMKGLSGHREEYPVKEGELQVLFGDHSGLKDRLKSEEGGYLGILGAQPNLRDNLSGLEGEFYGSNRGLSGQTLGLKGQEGGSLGISGAQPNLKDSLPGLEGDSYEQYSTISSKNSGSEIIGGISPKINMSYDTVKRISGETPILKGQEGDVDGHHDVLIGRTKGLNGEEGDLNGQHNVLSRKNSDFEIIGGTNPQTMILQDGMKGTSDRTKRFVDQEDRPLGISGFQPYLRNNLPGLEGEFYGSNRGLSGQTLGLKGQEGGSLGISGAQPNLKDSLPGLEGDSYEQYSAISSKNSRPEIIGGISPKINMSYDTVKGISGETPILKGQEGDVDGHHDVLSVRGSEFIGGITPQMKGLSGHREDYPDKEGDFYGQSHGLSGKTLGLKGQEGGSLGISGAQPNLKDSLPGLEGDSYEQYSTISSKNSGYEIIGGISPKINMSYDTVKGISGETHILKGQEGDVDGYHDVLIDRTKGWNGEERGSLNMKDDFSHFTIESENISTITEENVNPPRNIPTLLFENLLEHSSADSNADSNSILTSVSNSFSNFGNKIPYIVVPFILILIILGITYKYFAPVWRKKLKKKQDTKKIINLCDKHKAEMEVTNTLIENN